VSRNLKPRVATKRLIRAAALGATLLCCTSAAAQAAGLPTLTPSGGTPAPALLGPSVSQTTTTIDHFPSQTANAVQPDYLFTVCTNILQNINASNHYEYGYLSVTCDPNDGVVSNVAFIFWQRPNPNATGGWVRNGAYTSSYTYGTPFESGDYGYPCKSGWQDHVEMIWTTTTRDGGSSHDADTNNGTCQ
jgi:hypothetical protein